MKFNSGNAKSMEELRVIVDHLEAEMAAQAKGSLPIVGNGDGEENVARAKAAPQVLAMAAEVVCHLVDHMDVIARGKYTAPYVAAALVATAEVIRDVHVQTEEEGTYFDAVIKAVNRALVSSMSAVAFRTPEAADDEEDEDDGNGEA